MLAKNATSRDHHGPRGLPRRRPSLLRTVRHWVLDRTTDAALRWAPRLSASGIGQLTALVSRLGPHCPVVARQVAENMRSAGLYSPAAHRAYFAAVARHLAGALHALRCAPQAVPGGMSPELADVVMPHLELDASFGALHEHVRRAGRPPHRGAILVGPHIAGYLLHLARLNQELPLTVYLRYSKDARRRAAKERWYQATGVGWISEPPDAGGAFGRLGRMAAAIAAGRTLFITPDLPQKRDAGVAVRCFDREIWLPEGPAVLALRTGAPLFMLLAQPTATGERLTLQGPYPAEDRASGRAARRAAIQRRMQWFAEQFQAWLTQDAPLWYLWGDKRWTRVWHDDPRYGRRTSAAESNELVAPASGCAGG